MACCVECPRRYLVVTLGFIGLLVSIGFRTCFSLVLTNVMKRNVSDENAIFHNCIPKNSTNNLQLDLDGKVAFLFQTVYFCGSIITQIPGGILATRFSSKRVCGISIFISSLLFIALPFAITTSDILVFVIRFVQGVIEGCSIPALNGVISAWAPPNERSRLITIAYAGAYISPAVALIFTGVTSCKISWNSIFFIYGGCGVLWFILWMVVVSETPANHPSLGQKERALFHKEGHHVQVGSSRRMAKIPWKSILKSLPVFAILVGAFCRNWIFSMLITQQPQYFKDVYHKSAADIGLLSALPHLLMTIVVISGGMIFDKLITHKIISTTCARRLAETLGFGIEASCIMALGFIDDFPTALTLLSVGVALSGLAISGYQVNPLDLAPQYASIITGIVRLGSVGAILSTIVASSLIGEIKDKKETLLNWQHLFIIAAVIHFAGVLFYAVFASGKRQTWSEGNILTVTYDEPSGEWQNFAGETTRLFRSMPVYDDEDVLFGSTTRYLNSI